MDLVKKYLNEMETKETSQVKLYDLTSNAQRVFDLGIKRANSNFVNKFEDYKNSYSNVLTVLREKNRDKMLLKMLKGFSSSTLTIDIYDKMLDLQKAPNLTKDKYERMHSLYKILWSLTRTSKWSETFDIGDLVNASIFIVNALVRLHKANKEEPVVTEESLDLLEAEDKLPSKANTFVRLLNKVKSFNKDKFRDLLQASWIDFLDTIKSKNLEPKVLRIINKVLGSHYTSLDMISKLELKDATIEPDAEVNENFSEWWKTVKSEGFPIVSFYPALQVWLEIDKVFKSADIDAQKMAVYAVIWIFLVSGKYVAAKTKKELRTAESLVIKKRFREDADPGSWCRRDLY